MANLAPTTVGMFAATLTVTYSANMSDTASGGALAVGGLRVAPPRPSTGMTARRRYSATANK